MLSGKPKFNTLTRVEQLICEEFDKHEIPFSILNHYSEPHRFYHNFAHIDKIVKRSWELSIYSPELLLAIVFHDIIYNPKSSDNEERSAELFYSFFQNDEIKQAILDTKNHKPTTKLSEQLIALDLEVLSGSLADFIDFERKIFKEYQFVDYQTYKAKRIEILTSLGTKEEFINYVNYRNPSIGLFAGSFNPFHKGHLNILQKAEQIFDKVIVARGVNPDKTNEKQFAFPKYLDYHQIESYDGLLTDFIKKLNYPVTLIRGIRGGSDLSYETNQYRFLQEFYPDIRVVLILCDKQYEHISSSAVRNLSKFGKSDIYL